MSTDHKQAFLQALRGVGTSHVAKAFNSITPGINWMGCSKGHMAEEYAGFKDGDTTNTLHRYKSNRVDKDIDLELLVKRAKARAAGRDDWYKIHRITNP